MVSPLAQLLFCCCLLACQRGRTCSRVPLHSGKVTKLLLFWGGGGVFFFFSFVLKEKKNECQSRNHQKASYHSFHLLRRANLQKFQVIVCILISIHVFYLNKKMTAVGNQASKFTDCALCK